MPRLAIPNLGNYSIALASICDCLGVEPWTSTCTSAETLALGTAAVPESVCLPLKAYTGHFIKASLEGVEYGVMVNSIGFCRLRYYVTMQQKILEEQGYAIRLFGLGYDGIKPPFIRHFDPSVRGFLTSMVRVWRRMMAVDKIETRAWHCRAREVRAGHTTDVMQAALRDLSAARTTKEIRRVTRSIPERFAPIELDEDKRVLRVGLLGEAALLRDRLLNQNVEETLGSLGVEVRNFFLLGADLMNIFKFKFGNEFSEKKQLALAKPYLHTPIAGHALDSVANTIRCARDGYDGVVHLCPTGCMPEISVRPIVRRAAQDEGIPLLELTFDEHSSHVGVTTRLEAFAEMLRDRARSGVACA